MTTSSGERFPNAAAPPRPPAASRRRLVARWPIALALAGPLGLFGERLAGGYVPPLTALTQLAPALGALSLLGALALLGALVAGVGQRRKDTLVLGASALLLLPTTFGPLVHGELFEPEPLGSEASDLSAPPFPRAARVALRVLTANLGDDRSDGADVARVLRAVGADLIALQEVGRHHLPALDELRDLYPYQRLEPRGIQGIGLLSRVPLGDVRLLESARGRPTLLASVRVGARTVRVATAHPSAWVAVLGRLDTDAQELVALADDLAAHGPALLCGDLNTTDRTWLFRRLLASGLRDAWQAQGHGFGASWPLFGRWRGLPSPPLVRIDHVLTTVELEPLAIAHGPDVGSDHVPMVCDLGWAALP